MKHSGMQKSFNYLVSASHLLVLNSFEKKFENNRETPPNSQKSKKKLSTKLKKKLKSKQFHLLCEVLTTFFQNLGKKIQTCKANRMIICPPHIIIPAKKTRQHKSLKLSIFKYRARVRTKVTDENFSSEAHEITESSNGELTSLINIISQVI